MTNPNPFQAEAVQNYAQKCCVALVLDTSGSMNGQGISQLNQGIQAFFDEIRSDTANLGQKLEIGVITFDSTVERICEPKLAEFIDLPALASQGSTLMVDGVREGISMVRQRKEWYKSTGQRYYRPWVIMITDGASELAPATVAAAKALTREQGVNWQGVLVGYDAREYAAYIAPIATSIVEVGDGVATRYKGNFSHYAQQRDLRLLTEARQFKSQRDWFEKEMDYIRRNMAGQNSAQAKGRLKRLQRVQLMDRPKGEKRSMQLQFGEAKGRSGQTVMEAEDLTVAIGSRTLIEHGAFRVQFGETVAVLGRNGAGKTTLLRLLAGIGTPRHGVIKRALNLRIGYFSQDKSDLPQDGTVLDALRALDRTVEEKELRDHLALFLFCGDDVEKPVADLSGGEKQRLSLARMLRTEFDLLCLDEPTNHLDVSGTEGLEQALKEYPGTVVIVSHDRRLVREIADRVLWVEGGAIRTFDGGFDQCQQKLAEERAERTRIEAEEREKAAKKAAAAAAQQPQAQKAIETGKVRNPLMFQKLEEKIMTLEEQVEATRAAMMDPDNYASTQKMKALQQKEEDLKKQLQDAYAQWENWQ
jgi:ATP-binding cassette subfamily F protein 3